jgi:hypothetical protein
MSSHGERAVSGAGSSGVPKTSSAQIIWARVVPHLDGVLTTMSSGRNGKPSHRLLSVIPSRYRVRGSVIAAGWWRGRRRGASGGYGAAPYE